MQKYLIKDIQVVNEGQIINADVLITNGRIEKIGPQITQINTDCTEINGEGKYLLPGCIDDQVHFREPGLTHKATIATEAKAAVAGGVTSFMEMPNTQPPVFTQELLEDKYAIGAASATAISAGGESGTFAGTVASCWMSTGTMPAVPMRPSPNSGVQRRQAQLLDRGTRAAESLKEQAQRLNQVVGTFRVDAAHA